ncbi:MAG: SDR family NAD(P)-dependent oxidoreductase [Acidimicrobiales bacterium]
MTHPTRALVIGGGSGIGAAVADRYRGAGDQVLTWDRSGGDITCDIADPAQVADATTTTIAQLGIPTQVTITAGVGHSGMLLDVDPEEWDRVMGINAKGVWLAMRALARPMLDGEGGSIVATSSVSARLADRSMGLYCASKAALDMVIRVAADEWAPRLRVNGVGPGVTDTPMLGGAPAGGHWLAGVAERTAMGRLGGADDIAETVAGIHGMSWVTGQIILCDGGLSLHSPINPLGDRR